MKHPITLQLSQEEVEYLISFLDEESQDSYDYSLAYSIRGEILRQVYE